jgi:hypothetical protein
MPSASIRDVFETMISSPLNLTISIRVQLLCASSAHCMQQRRTPWRVDKDRSIAGVEYVWFWRHGMRNALALRL